MTRSSNPTTATATSDFTYQNKCKNVNVILPSSVVCPCTVSLGPLPLLVAAHTYNIQQQSGY